MFQKIAKDLPHFLSLFGVLFAGFLVFVLFSYDRKFQMFALLATASGYFTWGVVHHIIHKDLSLFVIIEYAIFALLGIAAVLSVILTF